MATLDHLKLANFTLETHPDGVLLATLNRPAKRNALDEESIENLIELFSAIPRSDVRAVVLAAAGDHFCAGLDLVEHHRKDRSPALICSDKIIITMIYLILT